ncbi:DsrE family protein [Yeosuana sp. MJ-SS3]|uniref:DsrE family protein n=1 Tax=Gilvirhabdus luticola TaxID=3079858 RepID=A0ABU3U922_9FLAO|nr:DsrE family protein [Yeosuana sp. MJ-SS3]MDU8886857.1 DsrE family protein [Yeosuana sp. MJ-SS3]
MKKKSALLGALLFSLFVLAQQPKKVKGTIIKEYGKTFEIVNPEYKTEINSEFKVIFDVDKSPDDKSEVNKYIEVAANFLNMHAHAGMKPEQLNVAMTIHASAWKDVLNNEVYKEKFGVANPNLELINELSEAGVDIIICGQAAAKREMSRDDIIPNVKIALSATTALIQYQNQGYRFIKY